MTGSSPPEPVYTPAMVAEMMFCSEQQVRNMVRRGELRAF